MGGRCGEEGKRRRRRRHGGDADSTRRRSDGDGHPRRAGAHQRVCVWMHEGGGEGDGVNARRSPDGETRGPGEKREGETRGEEENARWGGAQQRTSHTHTHTHKRRAGPSPSTLAPFETSSSQHPSVTRGLDLSLSLIRSSEWSARCSHDVRALCRRSDQRTRPPCCAPARSTNVFTSTPSRKKPSLPPLTCAPSHFLSAATPMHARTHSPSPLPRPPSAIPPLHLLVIADRSCSAPGSPSSPESTPRRACVCDTRGRGEEEAEEEEELSTGSARETGRGGQRREGRGDRGGRRVGERCGSEEEAGQEGGRVAVIWRWSGWQEPGERRGVRVCTRCASRPTHTHTHAHAHMCGYEGKVERGKRLARRRRGRRRAHTYRDKRLGAEAMRCAGGAEVREVQDG